MPNKMRKSSKEIIKNIHREGKVFTPDVLRDVYKTIGVDPVVIGKEEKIIEQRLVDEGNRFVPNKEGPIFNTSINKPHLSLRALFQKPRFVSLIATAMVGVILTATVITLGVNGFFNIGTSDSSNSGNTVTVPQPIQNDQQAFSIGALTSNVLFDYVEQSSTNDFLRALMPPEPTDGDIILPQLSPYLEMVEQLLSSEGQFEVISESSDRVGYEFKETFIAFDAFGNNMDYIIYYNVIELSEDGDEATYRFTGIITYQESEEEYTIEGRRTINENTTKVSMLINYSTNYYIRSEYITEEDTTKYRFRIYDDGDLLSDSSLKIEFVDERLSLTLSFVEGDDSYKYKIDYDQQDSTLIHVDYSLEKYGLPPRKGRIDIRIVVDEDTGEVGYILLVKPEGGGEEEKHEDRGHGHGHGQGGGPGGGNGK